MEYVIGVLISYAVDVEVDFKTPPGLRSTTVMTRRLATMFQCLGDR